MKITNLHKFSAGILLSLIFTIVIFPYSILAAPADLDPTFGIGGEVTTDFRSYSDVANSLALQPDGKLVAAGYSWSGPSGSSSTDFVLARYNVDGSLDTTFGTGGKVITDFSGDNDLATSVVIQPDGKILAGGVGGSAFGLARYNPNGSLDVTFGIGGKVTTSFSSVYAAIRGLALQADGKIVAAGNRYVAFLAVGPDYDIALARYNPDGSLDPTFGTGGTVSTSLAPVSNEMVGHGVAIQADGHILVPGQSGPGNFYPQQQNFIVARYATNGSFDGFTSITFTPQPAFPGNFDTANAIAIQEDGKILVVGYASSNLGGTSPKFAIARFNSDLSLDMSFGVGGKVTTECANSHAATVAIQTDGKFVAAGGTCMARYNPDGTLDATFGAGGIIDSIFFVTEVRIQTDGKIVTAGFVAGAGSYTDFGLARYLGDPVVPSTTSTTTTTTTTTSTTTTTNCNDQNKGNEKDKGKGHDKGKCKGNVPIHDKGKGNDKGNDKDK